MWCTQQTNASRIPSNVLPSAPVQGHVPPLKATVYSSKTVVEQLEPVSNVLEKLSNLIANLPESIPEALDHNRLAAFSENPAKYDNPSLTPNEL